MSKATLVFGLAVGYVLGARAGKERYEQIKAQAGRLLHDPRVQKKATQAQDLARGTAPKVGAKVADAAHQAADKVKQKGPGTTSGPTGSPTGGGAVDTTPPIPAPAPPPRTAAVSPGRAGGISDV